MARTADEAPCGEAKPFVGAFACIARLGRVKPGAPGSRRGAARGAHTGGSVQLVTKVGGLADAAGGLSELIPACFLLIPLLMCVYNRNNKQ